MLGVADRREVDEEGPAELGRELRGGREREPRLAGAARAGQRHEPDVRPAGELDQGCELLVAADQRRRLRREVDEDGLCARAWIVLARAAGATGWPPRQARTASITSRHEAVRSSSFLASARATTSSSAAGSSGRSSVGAGAGSSRCACMTATSVSRSNGFFPVRHSKSRQPKA